MSLISIAAKNIERWRYDSQEWATLDDPPKEYTELTLGNFEAFYQGYWRKIHGSYMVSSKVGQRKPWVWIEKLV